MAEETEKKQLVDIPWDNQSVLLPGEERIRVSHFFPQGNPKGYLFDDARTLYGAFLRGMKLSDDGPCLGERTGEKGEGPYEFLKYSEVLKKAHDFGSGLVQIGIPPGQKSHVGIYGKNCTSWVVAALSCDAYSRVSVPLYDTLGPQAVEHIINEAELSVVVCQNTTVKGLLDNLKNYPVLKHLVTWGEPLPEDLVALAKQLEVSTYTVEEIEKLGSDNPVDVQLPTPEDICTICYTSGTTGLPKGAICPHSALVAAVVGVNNVLGEKYLLTPNDSHISFLPMAHSMERVAQCLFFHYGCKIGFSRGDPKLLVEDIQVLQPTVFVGVPRLFAKVYDKIMVGVSSSFLKSTLMKAGMWWKGRDVDRGVHRQDTVFDSIVFRRVQELFGGRVRLVVTGSAPIPRDVLRFFRIALGCPVFEGYGQTETCTCGTFTIAKETDAGHVGPPVATMAIKLVDVPELDYFSKNDEGEICFKGPGNFVGYYKNEEKTAETIDKDGWVHSGDIGKWLPNGVLKIIDRKKQIFKTQQGEYIAPEKIENTYRKSLFVEQVFLFGNSLKPAVIAVVVPDEEYLTAWARDRGIVGDMKTLCANEDVQSTILAEMTKIGKESSLKSFEQAKAIHLHHTPFTIEEGLLTPTQKLVRRNIEKAFAQQLEEMYLKLDQSSKL